MSDRGSCTLDQLALATLLTTARYDRHLRRMRTVYAARRTALTDAFARHAPRVQLTGLAAGFHAVAPLPPGADETAVIAAARRRRVGLHGIDAYRGNPDPAAPPALVMGFGNVRERAIDPAVAAVAGLLSRPARGRAAGPLPAAQCLSRAADSHDIVRRLAVRKRIGPFRTDPAGRW